MMSENGHNGNGKRAYTDKQIAEALAILDSCGGNVSQASKETGIPRKTIEGWATGQRRLTTPAVVEELAQMRQEKRLDLAETISGLLWKLADAIPDKIAAATLSQTATAFGIFFDKGRLLEGKSTGILEIDEARGKAVQALVLASTEAGIPLTPEQAEEQMKWAESISERVM